MDSRRQSHYFRDISIFGKFQSAIENTCFPKRYRRFKLPRRKNSGSGKPKAFEATALAHKDGGVPNLLIKIKDRSPESLGQLIYFFESSIAMTGYLNEINPFDQPGVEMYKKNMFKLLNKPGY